MRSPWIICAAAMFAIAASGANAACYADYKAKRDNPLRLHYGVIELSGSSCQSRQSARAEVAEKLGNAGWELLSIMSIFDESGLDQRRDSAATFFLRY